MCGNSGSVSLNTWVTLDGKVDIQAKVYPDSEVAEFTFAGIRFGMTIAEETLEHCAFEFVKALKELRNSRNEELES
jgi:hypothetical protein